MFKQQSFYHNTNYIWSPYICKLKVNDGLLLYNLLSLELLYLDDNEMVKLEDKSTDLYKELVKKWFYISSDISTQSMVYLIRHRRLTEYNAKLDGKIVYATILTTTECNAKCPYCYESECARTTLSEENCKKISEFLKKNSNGITIRWFGGEPLINAEAITSISSDLQKNGVQYSSNIITNGYLLNRFSDDVLVNLWKLNKIQITIDGTKQVYLDTKKLPCDSYDKIIEQICRCARLGIKVNVRVHVTLENSEDIAALLKELNLKFQDADEYRKNIYIYLAPLFIGLGNIDTVLTESQDVNLAKKYIELDRLLRSLQKRRRKISIPKIVHCMADSRNHIVITPTGDLTVCEHCSDREIVGNLDLGIINIPDKWYEPTKKQPECNSCFYYPFCNKLSMCESESYCTTGNRLIMEYKTQTIMWQYYNKWKSEINKSGTCNVSRNLKDLIYSANHELGVNNSTKYNIGRFHFNQKDPWCITFLCWLFYSVFGENLALKYLCLFNFSNDVIKLLEAFKDKNMFSYHDVQPGYIIFLRMNRQWTNHAELVIDVTDTSIITIGGNCGGKVQKNEYARDDERISGFGKINYE